MHMVYAVTTAV